MANPSLQPTVKKLRFLPSAELSRWASEFGYPAIDREMQYGK